MADAPPPLTVALPTFNGARHLPAALAGILSQQDAAFDLLVCDDRSDDDTVAVARRLCGDRARVEVNPERLGLAGNWNRCVERSRTDWVAIFHQDDVMRPGHLAAHLAAIAAAGDRPLGLVAGPATVIDADGRPVPPEVVEPGGAGLPPETPTPAAFFDPGAFVPFLAARNPLRCSAVTTNRAAHAEAGGFDPSLRYVVDWDFWLRVARRRAVAWQSGPPTVAVRWHPASETHRFKAGTADLDEAARLLAGLFSADSHRLPDPRRLAREAHHRLALAYLNRAYDAARSGQPPLARSALLSALRLSPGLVGSIARDPRLSLRLAGACLRPSGASTPARNP